MPEPVDVIGAIADSTPEQDRIAAVLRDCDRIVRFRRAKHFHGCLCGALADRIRRTLS